MAGDRFQRVFIEYATTEAASDTGKPLVLIIDDDSAVRQSLQYLLQREAYRTIACKDGDEGLQAMHAGVCAVILDIKMPGKDGFQVYEEIKARFPMAPIIFYSAYQDAMESIALKQGYTAFSYIDKDGDADKLLASVQRAVSYSRTMGNIVQSAPDASHSQAAGDEETE